MIPFIVKPLDELAEVAMDVTFRKGVGALLRIGAACRSRRAMAIRELICAQGMATEAT